MPKPYRGRWTKSKPNKRGPVDAAFADKDSSNKRLAKQSNTGTIAAAESDVTPATQTATSDQAPVVSTGTDKAEASTTTQPMQLTGEMAGLESTSIAIAAPAAAVVSVKDESKSTDATLSDATKKSDPEISEVKQAITPLTSASVAIQPESKPMDSVSEKPIAAASVAPIVVVPPLNLKDLNKSTPAKEQQPDPSAEQRISFGINNLDASIRLLKKSIDIEALPLASDLIKSFVTAQTESIKAINEKLKVAFKPEDFLKIEMSDEFKLVKNMRTLADTLIKEHDSSVKSLAAIKEFELDTVHHRSVAGWIKVLVGAIVFAAIGLAVGAGLGFAAGYLALIWTGPGAFFTAALGLIDGATKGVAFNYAAGSVGAAGLGLLTSVGIFARNERETKSNSLARSIVREGNSIFASNIKEIKDDKANNKQPEVDVFSLSANVG